MGIFKKRKEEVNEENINNAIRLLKLAREQYKQYDAIASAKGSIALVDESRIVTVGNFVTVIDTDRFYNEIKGYAIRERAKIVAQIKYLQDKLKEYEKLVNGK